MPAALEEFVGRLFSLWKGDVVGWENPRFLVSRKRCLRARLYRCVGCVPLPRRSKWASFVVPSVFMVLAFIHFLYVKGKMALIVGSFFPLRAQGTVRQSPTAPLSLRGGVCGGFCFPPRFVPFCAWDCFAIFRGGHFLISDARRGLPRRRAFFAFLLLGRCCSTPSFGTPEDISVVFRLIPLQLAF